MRLAHNIIKGLINIVYPTTCHVCKNKLSGLQSERFVCTSCWVKIKLNRPPFCLYCGRNLMQKKHIGNICAECSQKVVYFDQAFSPCLYEGELKELIHNFKYCKRDYLGEILALPMVEFLEEYSIISNKAIDFIIPIPLSRQKMREREFNQSAILAKLISEKIGKPLLENILLKSRNSRTQTELKDVERFKNVNNSFSVINKDKIYAKNILLVDDVLTTGATCSEAALVLKNNGANKVFCLALAN